MPLSTASGNLDLNTQGDSRCRRAAALGEHKFWCSQEPSASSNVHTRYLRSTKTHRPHMLHTHSVYRPTVYTLPPLHKCRC